MQRLPPLNALRVFESTSRLLSAKQAAEELHVTPAAVSHHLKSLESHLGFPLFIRQNRQLVLTDMGQRYAHIVQNIFKKLTDETTKLTQNSRSQLALSVEPAFAIYWLIPRLCRFKKLHPNIELRISSSYELVNFKTSNIDIGIRWGKGSYQGLISHLLFRNELFPVCSPLLLKKHPIKKPKDLQHYVLLHETTAINLSGYPDWMAWSQKFNAPEINPESGLFFETGYLVIQAAIEGQGIALERAALTKDAIKSGKLVKLFNASIRESNTGYYLVFPENKSIDPKIAAFLDWIKQEIKNSN